MDNREKTTRPEKINTCWHFPDLDHGQSDGLNDPILQYFEGNHEMFIARETIQNSIDARLHDESPVIVKFEMSEILTSDLPGRDELLERVHMCLQRSRENGDDKGISYFKRTKAILNLDNMTLLRIGDYNTFGLNGGDEEESGRWYRLVKSVGENRMTGPGGGSFGIGKGAPIAASGIRTVYYSTRNENESVFQGCASMITHDFDGKKRRGKGFFGENGYKALRGDSNIPQYFLRKERGTDVFIAAYNKKGDDWKIALAESVLKNFWMAIYSHNLEVHFVDGDNSFEITPESLPDNLKKYTEDSAYQYYLTVTKPTLMKEKQHQIIGNCQLYIRQDPDLTRIKNVALMRKPKMVVQHRKFRTMQDGYAGVFICDDDEGNKILRDMEPPEHDKWDFNLSKDKTVSRHAISEMNDWIKDTLREMIDANSGDPEDIEGLDKYLPFEDDADIDGGSFNKNPSQDTAITDESPNEIGAERDEQYDKIEDVVQRPSSIRTGGGNPTKWNGGGEGGKGEKEKDGITRINTEGIKFRTIATSDTGDGTQYCLILNPVYDQTGSVSIISVGDDENYPVTLAYAKDWESGKEYITSGSFIKDISLEKDTPTKIKIGLHSNTKYALGIEKYEH